jgi:excisionase family DNA binding protein
MQRDMNKNLKATLSPRETAEFTGFGITYTYKLLRDGTIPSIKIGNRFYVPKSALQKFLESCGKPK